MGAEGTKQQEPIVAMNEPAPQPPAGSTMKDVGTIIKHPKGFQLPAALDPAPK
jgi:hypothetical protein